METGETQLDVTKIVALTVLEDDGNMVCLNHGGGFWCAKYGVMLSADLPDGITLLDDSVHAQLPTSLWWDTVKLVRNEDRVSQVGELVWVDMETVADADRADEHERLATLLKEAIGGYLFATMPDRIDPYDIAVLVMDRLMVHES